jgi:predicted dinucleotide-binding enzyme
MNIAIIGAGNIGSNLAGRFSKAGHSVTISFSQDQQRLIQKAHAIGNGVVADTVANAVMRSEVVVLSCLWADIDTALAQAGSLADKIVIDVTNQYTATGLAQLPTSVAVYNQARIPQAKLIRSFNMLTADAQKAAGQGQRLSTAMFYAAEDTSIKPIAEQLIKETGFTPIYIGGWDVVQLIEASTGFVLGKSYTPADAQRIADVIQQGNLTLATELANTLG